MSQNIVLLSGSPRKDGNTDKLAAAFIEGAKSSGKTVRLFRTADMEIGGCIGCQSCFAKGGVCFQNDDMEQIIEKLRIADAIVFASPIYFFAISAQLKLAIDRTYALLKETTSIKRTALLLTCADIPSDEAEAGVVLSYQKMAVYKKWEDAGFVVAPELRGKDDIVGRPELEQARKLGQEI